MGLHAFSAVPYHAATYGGPAEPAAPSRGWLAGRPLPRYVPDCPLPDGRRLMTMMLLVAYKGQAAHVRAVADALTPFVFYHLVAAFL